MKKLLKEIRSLALIALVLFAGRSAIADWNRIPSGSMEPSLYIGDLVLVNRLAYDLKVPFTTVHLKEWSNPKRGEIVVFYRPQDKLRMIKRVIGEPGDTIEMVGNVLIVNGQPASYEDEPAPLDYQLPANEKDVAKVMVENLAEKQHQMMLLRNVNSMSTFGPITVPEGEYFMLGDNRDGSGDSRYFGFVPRNNIIGRAERVLISWDKDNHYKPRFSRTLLKV